MTSGNLQKVGNFEVFPNPKPERNYEIRIDTLEFTCLCPRTGQPDFATLLLKYVPDSRCVELKSLREYLRSFRNVPAFHEAVVNEIVDAFCSALAPRFVKLTASFNVRGGLSTTIVVKHSREP